MECETELPRVGWINDNLHVYDLTTVEECDEARMELVTSIAEIESQLEEAAVNRSLGEEELDPHWQRRAKHALKMKRGALQAVQTKRSSITKAVKAARQDSQDRVLINIIKEHCSPEFWQQCLDIARNSHPELFGR